MKNFKLLSVLTGMMFFVISCETEPYQDDELEATNLKTSKEDGCETGFAICAADQSTCFLDDGFNRWGWTIGPVSEAGFTHRYEIYAGAGKCDISKGELAGKVWLKYKAGVAEVKFEAENGYVLKETHIYIGNEPYPMQERGKKLVPTVAPGQYPYKHDNLDGAIIDSYTVDGLSGDIYLIAHSVVCAKGD